MLVDKVYKKIKSNVPSNKSYSILLAISGGIDSIVLLDILSQIQKFDKLLSNISLVFINYAINDNSHDRGELCSSLANQYKYKIIKKDSCLGVKNFESNARYERYNYLNQIANNDKIDFILTAHHKDDQIETLLMKYYDDSDWISYMGIREKYNKILRPMLDISKEKIYSYAKDNNLSWIDDPSNMDINFRRNKIRHIKLPEIYKNNSPLIDELLLRHDNAKNRFKLILNKIDVYLKEYVKNKNPDFIILSNKTINIKDSSTFKLFYKHILNNYFNGNIIKTKGFWSSYFKFIANADTGSKFILNKDFGVMKDRNHHYLYKNKYLNQNNIKINKDNDVKYWYDTQIVTSQSAISKDVEVIDVIRIPYKKFNDGIYIRNWQYGDKGYNSSQNIKKIFINNKVSLFDKMKYPIITDKDDNILCVPKLYNYYTMNSKYKAIYWIRK